MWEVRLWTVPWVRGAGTHKKNSPPRAIPGPYPWIVECSGFQPDQGAVVFLGKPNVRPGLIFECLWTIKEVRRFKHCFKCDIRLTTNSSHPSAVFLGLLNQCIMFVLQMMMAIIEQTTRIISFLSEMFVFHYLVIKVEQLLLNGGKKIHFQIRPSRAVLGKLLRHIQ